MLCRKASAGLLETGKRVSTRWLRDEGGRTLQEQTEGSELHTKGKQKPSLSQMGLQERLSSRGRPEKGAPRGSCCNPAKDQLWWCCPRALGQDAGGLEGWGLAGLTARACPELIRCGEKGEEGRTVSGPAEGHYGLPCGTARLLVPCFSLLTNEDAFTSYCLQQDKWCASYKGQTRHA